MHDKNKTELTPKNIMNQMYKFYKQTLHPLPADYEKPNFKHVLLWALQTGEYSINWNFTFDKQLNWSATEAKWRLMLDAEEADWSMVQKLMFNTGENASDRHDGSWARDGYGDSKSEFEHLAVKAKEQKDIRTDDRAERMMELQYGADDGNDESDDNEHADNSPRTHRGSAEDALAYIDSLRPSSRSERNTHTPPTRGLPPWLEEIAQAQEDRYQRSPSVDSNESRTSSERRRDARPRYAVDDLLDVEATEEL